MSQKTPSSSPLSEPTCVGTEPITDQTSKNVMLCAERQDRLLIDEVHRTITHSADPPDSITVSERSQTYYGPKLMGSSSNDNWMLTSPGPDSHLLLWRATSDSGEYQSGWEKIAEVSVCLGDDTPQYDLCPQCGDPLRTLEHEREALTGACIR